MTFAKGMVGVIAPVGGTIVSTLQWLEPFLRVLSLLVGISVGVVTIWSLIKKTKEK